MGLSLSIESRGPSNLTAIRAALALEESEPRLVVRDIAGGIEVDVHPAAEPLEILEVDGKIRIGIKTGTAGAGLHAWVVDLIGRLEQRTGAPFDRERAHDSSDYVRTRDVDALLRFQAAYLSEVSGKILELLGGGHSSIALGMPHDVTFEHPALEAGAVLVTPLGPRDRAWLSATHRDGRAGFDALPWATPGLDARFFYQTALSIAWTEIRFRTLLDEGEIARIDRVLELLERAYALEPEGSYDFSLWSELFELKGEESLRATRIHLKAERDRNRSAVGYRRHPVTVQIGGGWRVRVPGELSTHWERDGRVWVCFDGKRSLHVSTVTANGTSNDSASTEATLDALIEMEDREGAPGGEVMLLKRGAIRGRASQRPLEPGLEIRAVSAVGPHGALGTFVLEQEDDRVWALEVWGNLEHDEARRYLPS
jgi:hypothetical protein